MKSSELQLKANIEIFRHLYICKLPYALQRNFNDILLGINKDIDIIAPIGSIPCLLKSFDSNNQISLRSIEFKVNRLELELNVFVEPYEEHVDIYLDIDYQVVLVTSGPRLFLLRSLRAFCRSVCFEDLSICKQYMTALLPIYHLSPGMELSILKNQLILKNKLKYAHRIEYLSNFCDEEIVFTGNTFSLVFNLLRRYWLTFRSVCIRFML